MPRWSGTNTVRLCICSAALRWLLRCCLLFAVQRVVLCQAPVCAAGSSCAPKGDLRKHHWPHARGHIGRYGSTPLPGPSDLNASLMTIWQHPDGRNGDILTSVLLDDQSNIYTTGMRGIFKLRPDGSIIWNYQTEFHAHMIPVLSGDVIYGGMLNGGVFALDLESGAKLWSGRCGENPSCEQDSSYVETYEGAVLVACDRQKRRAPGIPGNTRVCSLNASTGATLWEYASDRVIWNFLPMFPGDDTFVFQDCHGGIYRMGIHDGQTRWYNPPVQGEYSFTDGGTILGPGGTTAYTCSSLDQGQESTGGALRAYRVSDGKLLWDRVLPNPCTSWPAANADESLVVVPVGSLPSSRPAAFELTPEWFPEPLRVALHRLSIWFGEHQQWLWWQPSRKTAVHAYDARTGEQRWLFDDIPPWKYFASKGDEEQFLERFKFVPKRIVCGPATWGSPTISGDGTVYVGHISGMLYAIRDANGDGKIDSKTEVSTLDMGTATLHPGSAFAPGMMVYASCDRVFVFRSPPV